VTDPRLAARAIAGMVLGVLTLRLLGDRQLAARWADVPDTLAELILHGLIPTAGDPPVAGGNGANDADVDAAEAGRHRRA
jgi:hypothetical protein